MKYLTYYDEINKQTKVVKLTKEQNKFITTNNKDIEKSDNEYRKHNVSYTYDNDVIEDEKYDLEEDDSTNGKLLRELYSDMNELEKEVLYLRYVDRKPKSYIKEFCAKNNIKSFTYFYSNLLHKIRVVKYRLKYKKII